MKFTKQQAIKDLDSKFKDKNKDLDLSRTIEENVSNVMKIIGENDEITLEQFVAFVSPQIETAIGLMRHETSAMSALKEKEIQDLKDKLEKAGKENGGSGDEKYEKLMKEIELLKQEKEKEEKQKKDAMAKENLIAKMKEKGIKDQEWITTMLSKAYIVDGIDIEKEAEDYLKMFNKYKSSSVEIDTPKPPSAEAKKKLDDVIAAAAGIVQSQI